MSSALEGPDGPRQRDAGKSAAELADLLTRSATRDEEAFDELYGATAPRIFGLVLRILAQRALAEEVTQDVFAYVWNEAHRYDRTRGSAIGWIMTIAHRRAVDRVRSVAAAHTRDHVWARKGMTEAIDSTSEAAHASLEATRVRTALGALSPKQRTAIQLAYFDGYTHAEVAAHLGIPHGTAKTRIREGLRSLALLLDQTVAIPVNVVR